ncbi:MAG: hypothetical protein C0615_06470 [Desulfuromonas sp.]|nr:MAG: hypothetical protein C0615_06470 [Desulfuromonas sp.]
MSKKISIDPVTRIEGHLAVETKIEAGKVTDARIAGQMYRGFENLLLGRHPIDAARITQRICGICHEVHGIAASMALENLYGLQPTQNGLILRELILGLHLVTDHIFHFYQLTLPDYVDFGRLQNYRGGDSRVKKLAGIFNGSNVFTSGMITDSFDDTGLTVEMALGYAEAINIRKQAGSGLASLGGKVPFCHTILPGGLTTDITSDRLMNYANALSATTDFIRRFYLPQAIELAQHFRHYFELGQSHGNFYGNGGFSLSKNQLYSGGILRAGKRPVRTQFAKIKETVEATYLDPDGTPRAKKEGAYSWVKAMHYDGLPMEVGPLARLAVNNDREFAELLKPFKQEPTHSSVMTRILARAQEALKICFYLPELLHQYDLQGETINPPDMLAKPTGNGQGMSLAARGALNHQVTTENGKVTRYRLQVPSAWNFGPTAGGHRGTVEQALIGTPVNKKDGETAIEIGRIVRSFDPCLACAIH